MAMYASPKGVSGTVPDTPWTITATARAYGSLVGKTSNYYSDPVTLIHTTGNPVTSTTNAGTTNNTDDFGTINGGKQTSNLTVTGISANPTTRSINIEIGGD